MSRVCDLLRCSVFVLLVVTSLVCHSAEETSADDVSIGLTLPQYEARLKRWEKEVEARFVKAHTNDRQHLQAQLHAIQIRLQDIKQSYQEHIKSLTKRIAQLASIRGLVSDELLSHAQQALANGKIQQLDQLLHQMENQAADVNEVVAEANYQRCQIAKDEIRYRQASTLCRRAVQLVPGRTDYVSDLADLTHSLGEYQKAIMYYEQALANDLESFGEDHPDVAINRNNLGAAWDSLGQYEKAISYYEQALASDLKTHGEDHPDVAIDRNNLGMAWHALGEYQKAIVYLEQALASDLKTYGEEDLQVATYRNNLAGAWYALGDYKKASAYLEQALAGFEKVLGENHPNTKGVRANYQQLLAVVQAEEDKSSVSK